MHTGGQLQAVSGCARTMTTNNVRARTYLKLLFGTGAVLILFRVFSGHVVPRPTDITAGLDRLRPAPAPSIIPEPVTTVDTLPCAKLAGANETLVIIKTGATEIKDKLPVHFDTTLRCYPHSIIFSDYEEEYSGYQVVDALANVDKTLQDSHPDFELWRRLKEGGRAVLADDELSGPGVKLSGGLGKPENPGWKLDKWKFLPMLNETLVRYPEMKWYLFVETDTYIFWTTTLAWLATLDHTKPHYMGAQMQIGEVVFAHGGSAFVISQSSMRAAVELYRANQKEWEDFTNGHWAGDCVLGKALADSGTSLTWAWPIFQGVKPGGIDYSRLDYSKRIWCYPTISYHHMSPDEVADTWLFEEDMTAKVRISLSWHTLTKLTVFRAIN